MTTTSGRDLRGAAVALYVAGLAMGCVLGGLLGHAVGQAAVDTQLQTLRDTAQQAQRLAQAARQRSDQVQAQLHEQLQANATLTQERDHALNAATTGRPCLAARTLRVLDGAPGVRVLAQSAAELAAQAGAPATAASAVGAAAGSVERELISTDADVAHWILAAGQTHEACRAQLVALIDYLDPHQQAAREAP